MTLTLLTKKDVAGYITQLASSPGQLDLCVREDICFAPDTWVNVGEIRLHPTTITSPNESAYDLRAAVEFGGYEWTIPESQALKTNLEPALRDMEDKRKDKVYKSLEQGLQDLVRRALLLYPVFDSRTFASLPLSRPTTIVPDTNSIHQGALDFICAFLTPWARIKLPAIVHMEILNKVDGYFSIRRKPDTKASRSSALEHHILSQGGQRTLLRIELHSDAEMERGDLGADPLRGIVTESSDSEDRNLGLQAVVKCFADRLILETARRFATQVRPDHHLVILTSDQGMARMALAEGMDVFFFQARSAPIVLGRTITGTLYHPFGSCLHTVPLTDLLWETAVSFGAIRLSNGEERFIELWGIPADTTTSWQPLHASDDLLWGCFSGLPNTQQDMGNQSPPSTIPPVLQTETSTIQDAGSILPSEPKALTGSYSFSPKKMLQLLGQLVEKGKLSDKEARRVINIENVDNYKRYENFLLSGTIIHKSSDTLTATDTTRTLWKSLIERDFDIALAIIMNVVSFHQFSDYVTQVSDDPKKNAISPIPDRARATYETIGEALGAWLGVSGHGLTATNSRITNLQQFADLSIKRYEELNSETKSDWILTGSWLERLALKDSIHPIRIPELLDQCKKHRIMRVYAEGSTPDTRFDQHRMWVLVIRDKQPSLERVYLYHGSFVLPNTSAVRIKLMRNGNAS